MLLRSCPQGERLSGIRVLRSGIKGGVFIIHLLQVCLFCLFHVNICRSSDYFTFSFVQGSCVEESRSQGSQNSQFHVLKVTAKYKLYYPNSTNWPFGDAANLRRS